jgi:coenzyme F420-reducing hydrogenase alpha subunit
MAAREVKIRVPVLARVEGEGALDVDFADGRVTDLRLRIFEPPRFFEKLVEGRAHQDIPDMVARICGICPAAYQMSAVHALEMAYGVDPGPWVREIRRLLYCGEWLQSHALHIHLLAAPDFLGYGSAMEAAGAYPDEIRRGLLLQGLGNDIMRLVGGRSVHPVGVRVGGFYRAPDMRQVSALRTRLRDALPAAEELVRWTASLSLPEHEQDVVQVALRHPQEYPLNEGRIVADDGLDIPITEYEHHFAESHAPHSTALHSHYHGRPYLVGPLARLNLNLDRLPGPVRRNLERTGLAFPSRNMFHSVVARAVEVHYAVVEALRILDAYRPDVPGVEVTPRTGVGYGATEAPRGLLWHRWETGEDGRITFAKIVPPTSQNQARIEEDLRHSLEALGPEASDESLRVKGETVIRNYDPCISCATHFLRLRVTRR